MLARLLRACDRDRFEHAVLTLLDDRDEAGGAPLRGGRSARRRIEPSPLRRSIESSGVETGSLGLRGALSAPAALHALRRTLIDRKPAVLCSWLYYANAVAAATRRTLPRRPALLWNIRQGVPDLAREPLRVRTAIRIGAWVSRRPGLGPQAIVYNSASGAADHVRLGYPPSLERIVFNGLDPEEVTAGSEARTAARRALGIDDDALLVGAAGRDDPAKDHCGLVAAFARVSEALPAAHLLIAGPAACALGSETPLMRAIAEFGVSRHISLLGLRDDWLRLLPGLDCFVSSSISEGFPNAVAEAMAAEVPVVATAVGETEALLGPCGALVPPSDPRQLAEAILAALRLTPAARSSGGAASRARIAERFSMAAMASRYDAILESLAAHRE